MSRYNQFNAIYVDASGSAVGTANGNAAKRAHVVRILSNQYTGSLFSFSDEVSPGQTMSRSGGGTSVRAIVRDRLGTTPILIVLDDGDILKTDWFPEQQLPAWVTVVSFDQVIDGSWGTVNRQRSDGYSDGPYVAVRIFAEDDHWAIDAVDVNGQYSEAIWTVYNEVDLTREMALQYAGLFAKVHAPTAEHIRELNDRGGYVHRHELVIPKDEPVVSNPILHNLEDLVAQVRNVNGNNARETERWIQTIIEFADDHLRIKSEDVAKVVLAWSPGCDGGKKDFLDHFGIDLPKPDTQALFTPAVIFHSDGTVDIDWGSSLESVVDSETHQDVGDDDGEFSKRFDSIINPNGDPLTTSAAQAAALHRLAFYIEQHPRNVT